MDRSSNPSNKQPGNEGRGLRVASINPAPVAEPAAGPIDASAFVDTFYDNRWLIAGLTLLTTVIAVGYAVLAAPVYQSDILIQVEDNPNSPTDALSSLSQRFDIKSEASDEIEILQSRLVLTPAVRNEGLTIDVQPRRFPVFGRWWSTLQKGLSTPGIFGHGGYVWAQEHATVATFDPPVTLYGKPFKLVAGPNGQYTIENERAGIRVTGHVGEPLTVQTGDGPLTANVTSLYAQPGGTFMLTRVSEVAAVESLQKAMRIAQTTKDSDVIQASLQGIDANKTSAVLTEIGRQYIAQNIERKSAEAEKSLAFLNEQLPQLKRQLEESEDAYNHFRATNALIDLSEEGSAVLQQTVDAQNKLADLEQKRNELTARFTDDHPAVIAILNQESVLKQRLSQIDSKTRRLPQLEQTELRLQRDVQVNTDLYTGLLNSAEQLRLARAGKTGNARLVDTAVVSGNPVKPNRKLVVVLGAAVGLFGGCLLAWFRRQLSQGVMHAREIERDTGLAVYASVPHSKLQQARDTRSWSPSQANRITLLAHLDSDSLPIEALRSFRTALQFVLLEASNNIVLMTGPTPGVGKSFTSANLAAVLANSHQRVLLIDADMRDGDLHRHFGKHAGPGLADLIEHEKPFDDVVHRAVLPCLDLVARGIAPSNPSELLMSKRFTHFVSEIAAQYDVVLIDTPPVLAVADVGSLGQIVGSAFLVVRQGATTLAQIKESAKRLAHVGVTLDGLVLNDVKARPGDKTYGYGMYSYPGPRAKASKA
ncbi:polysaccharide biosynthesis tyrosine autokinase [Paraburkholderia rhizosphaerae]|uniref:Putative tyrosine-protein kinase EpsB n=1 Tax=Paraburkholderia rhizosphaerae TaxID=480658 RepID=A0A4R8LED7_9BURK|nr:polysaccharide biosynthesis tyrosine autokinase [Paraburkholderia rhizosphaerae]TDY40509.1 tyrosine-protein kinase Etk/Wzc [Paraburkholderia rhizosphaerae]